MQVQIRKVKAQWQSSEAPDAEHRQKCQGEHGRSIEADRSFPKSHEQARKQDDRWD